MTKRAFTLAEVLITIGIIGIVAAITIPALITNYQSRVYETNKTVFENRMGEALRQMNIAEELTGYTTTKQFVDALKKYMKIIEVCEEGKLTACFPDKINASDGEPIDVADADFIGEAEEWETGLMGIVLQNGHSAIIKYNPNCQTKGIASTVDDLEHCAMVAYDTNGKSLPNALNKDVQGVNGAQLSSGTVKTITLPSGLEMTEMDVAYEPINTCDQSSPYHYENNDNCANDYWAGATEACDNLTMELPSRVTQAQEILNWCVTNPSSCSSSNLYWLKEADTSNAYRLNIPMKNVFPSGKQNSYTVRCVK